MLTKSVRKIVKLAFEFKGGLSLFSVKISQRKTNNSKINSKI